MGNGKIPVAILAGGSSRRFGSNKALAPFGDGRIIDHIIELVRPVTDTIIIVSKEPGLYSFPGIESIEDSSSLSTPVVGILTAMDHLSSYEEVLIISCDTIWHPENLLSKLLEFTKKYGDLLIFSHDDQIHPFPGRYARSAVPYFKEALSLQDYRMQSIIRKMDSVTIDVDNWWIKNINRQEDLHEARYDKENLL